MRPKRRLQPEKIAADESSKENKHEHGSRSKRAKISAKIDHEKKTSKQCERLKSKRAKISTKIDHEKKTSKQCERIMRKRAKISTKIDHEKKTSKQCERIMRSAHKDKSFTKEPVTKGLTVKEVTKVSSSKGVVGREVTKKAVSKGVIVKDISKVPSSKGFIDKEVTKEPSSGMTSERQTADCNTVDSCPRQGTSREVEVFNFTGKTWMSDVTFVVQGKRIYCSKAVLAMFSPVFRSMFTEKNYKQKGTMVELPGKDYESFLDFLKCIFPNVTHPDITKQNVFKILSLAYEYNVGNLLQQCEEYLMKSIEVREPCINTLMRILTKAKQYKLNALKDFCIKILSEKDPFAVQASGDKLGLQDTLHFVQGEIVLKKHRILKKARSDLEKTCMAFEMTDVLQEFGGFEQAEAGKLELSLKIDKAEELSKQTATSEIVCLYGLRFSAQTVIYTASNTENDVSYLNLYLKCMRDGSVDSDWSCDVRAKCILKMRMTGKRSEQITKTKTFTFSENHMFFTGLKTKLGSSVGKNAGSLQGREFEAIIYFLANIPKNKL